MEYLVAMGDVVFIRDKYRILWHISALLTWKDCFGDDDVLI